MSFKVRRIGKENRSRFSWKRMFMILEIGRPLLRYYQDWKLQHEKEKKHEKRVMTLKRVFMVLISVLLALFLLAGVAKALLSLKVITLSSFTSITGTDVTPDENGFINILLMGQGDSSHDGIDLTDTIMIASIDPKETKSIVLLSIPRDLYFLETEKMGQGRVNSLFRDYKGYLQWKEGMKEEEASKAALKEISTEIGKAFGIAIQGVIKVDFIAFTQAVDTIGGIEIDVPYDIVDTEYPDENYGFQTFEIHAGLQTINGETALKYARSRHTTSDFDRSERQQQLLRAMATKVKAENLLKNPKVLLDFLNIFHENVEMTFAVRELVGLTGQIKDIEPDHLITMQLNDRNGLFDGLVNPGGFLYNPPRDLFEGASILLPVSIPEFPVTWKQIHALCQLLLKGRAIYLKAPTISVLNAGAAPGSARVLATELERFGFTVDNIDNSSIEDQTKSSILVASEEDYDLGLFFASLLGMNTTGAEIVLPPEEARRITILLGSDYSFTPFQDLVFP